MLRFLLMLNTLKHPAVIFRNLSRKFFDLFELGFFYISSNFANLSSRIERLCGLCNCMLNLPYICLSAIRNPCRCCFYHFRGHPIWTSNNCVEVRHYAASLTRKIYSSLDDSISTRLR